MDTVYKEAWSVGEVGAWLHELGLGSYATAFEKQLINGRVLEQVTGSRRLGLTAADGLLLQQPSAVAQLGKSLAPQRRSHVPFLDASSSGW
jgi:hypothetical protein